MDIIFLAALWLLVVLPIASTFGYAIYIALKVLIDGIRSGMSR